MKKISASLPCFLHKLNQFLRSRGHESHLDNAGVDWNNPETLNALDQLIVTFLNGFSDPPDLVLDFCHALCEDLDEYFKNCEEEEVQTQLIFLRFRLSLGAMHYGLSSGNHGITFDWAFYALSGEFPIDGKGSFQTNRLITVLRSNHPVIQNEITTVFVYWFHLFFTYCLKVGALHSEANELCELAAGVSSRAIGEGFIRISSLGDVDGISLLCAVYSWCCYASNPFGEQVARQLKGFYETSQPYPAIRARIALAFATTGGKFSGVSKQTWAQEVIQINSPYVPPANMLQAIAFSLDSLEDYEAAFGNIRKAIVAYSQSLSTHFLEDRVAYLLAKDFAFYVVQPFIALLSKARRYDLLIDLMQLWNDVSGEQQRRDDLLLAIPGTEEGMVYLSRGDSLIVNRDEKAAIKDITERTNAFLGTRVAFKDEIGFQLSETARIGVPNAPEAARFATSVNDFLALKELKTKNQILQSTESLFLMMGLQLPIQAAMESVSISSKPWCVSLERPLKDRELRNVLLWDGRTMRSDVEIEALKTLFSKNRVVIDEVKDENRNPEGFIERYSSDRYDAIFVAAHGAFDHYDPQRPRIVVNEKKEFVELVDLLSNKPNASERRLLVLNICDGAAFAIRNAPPKVGLAAAVASGQQAVVSHLWPVHEAFAPAFSLLLALQLIGQQAFFPAFRRALAIYAAGPGAIERDLRANIVGSQKITRWLGRVRTTSAVGFLGSPVFME